MKMYSSVFPPSLEISSPAAFAEPPAPNQKCNADRLMAHTCSQEIIEDYDVLTWLDRIFLYFKDILYHQ